LETGDIAVLIYMMIRYFIPPVAAFIFGLFFLKKLLQPNGQANPDKKYYEFFPDLILVALLGVLLHGMTDYAIFEPGVFTTFWFLMASLIAANSLKKPQRVCSFKPAPFIKMTTIITAFIICSALINYALIPVAVTTKEIEESNNAISLGRLEYAHDLLDSAAKDDKLSSLASSMNARLYMQHSQMSPGNSR
jgi:hypothetical protein